MKPYFIKYLPVEGKISSDDDFIYHGKVYSCLGRDEGWVWCDLGLGNPTSDGLDPGECEKAKLFLCSRDIQVGNIVWWNDPDKKPDWSGYYHVDSYEKIGDMYLLSGLLNGKQEKLSSDNDHLCRVVGEVSPGAVWIEEGMVFDESPGMYKGEWQALPIYKGDTHVTLLGSNRQRKAILDMIPVEKYIILFKCPNCKTYH